MDDKDKKDGAENQNQDQNQGDKSSGQDQGQSQSQNQDLTWQNKVKDKSYEEIVKMYGELSQKLGETSQELGDKRKLMEQANVVFAAINTPDREKIVRQWVQEIGGNKDGSDSGEGGEKPKPNEVRQAMVTDKIREFESKYGLNKLPADKRKEEGGRLGNSLWEMADPEGKYKTWDELVDHIPVAKLPKMLEDAYFLSHRDEIVDKMRQKEETSRLENEEGSIPGFSSASISGQEETLTAEETKVAQKLGIKPEKYLERKREMAKSRKTS